MPTLESHWAGMFASSCVAVALSALMAAGVSLGTGCGDKDGDGVDTDAEPSCDDLTGVECSEVGLAEEELLAFCDSCNHLWVCIEIGDVFQLTGRAHMPCSCMDANGYIVYEDGTECDPEGLSPD